MRRRNFTFIELVIVVTIMLLISGIAIVRVSRMPTSATLNRGVNELKKLFAQGEFLASTHGREVIITYSPELQQFILQDSVKQDSANRDFLIKKHHTVSLFEEIKVEFLDDNLTKFIIYPDGAVSGGEFTLSLEKLKFKLTPSPLTGQLLVKEEE